MDAIGFRVPIKQMGDFFTFNVTNIWGLALQEGEPHLQISTRFPFLCFILLSYRVPVPFYWLGLYFSLVLAFV
jgi:hypothetical protein